MVVCTAQIGLSLESVCANIRRLSRVLLSLSYNMLVV